MSNPRGICRDWQIVTLLELLEHNAEPFCRLSCVLGQALFVLRFGNPNINTLSGLAGSLGELQREIQRLDLKSVDKQLQRIHDGIVDLKTFPTDHVLEQLYDRLRDALEERLFLAVPSDVAGYYKQPEPLFGREVEARFPLASEDISEAGKCLALARGTAAVFHLMRVMELGVQKLGDHLGVTLTNEKNWQNILDEVNKAIKALDHKLPRTKALAEASSHLYAVKVAWRNEVMHPKQTYTLTEAMAIFSNARTFMGDLAGLV